MKNEPIEQKLEKANQILAQLFQHAGIHHLILTSLGNSIASGFSMVRTTKPLLYRNETFIPIMNHANIQVEEHHFARARENSDEQIFDWCIQNLKESDMHQLNQLDYLIGPNPYTVHGLSKENIEAYYPIEEESASIQDVLFQKGKGLANLVIYHGGTGSFLKAIIDHNMKKAFLGMSMDALFMDQVLHFIERKNMERQSFTQVYLCGAPNFLGCQLVHILNSKIQRNARFYSNTTYVKPVASRCFYRKYQDDKNSKGFSVAPDLHYNEEEYLKMNLHIIESIQQNYVSIKDHMIESYPQKKKLYKR